MGDYFRDQSLNRVDVIKQVQKSFLYVFYMKKKATIQYIKKIK